MTRSPSSCASPIIVTPSRFLETILTGPMNGRRQLYSRLGIAARDAIDELMNSALEFERNEIASLDRFLDWFSRGSVDVQRDPGQPLNEVRVMTVHGAKGLEAPVVILADATADPAKLGRTPITVDFELRAGPRAPASTEKGGALRAVRRDHPCAKSKRDLEEHMRLLYVALTRAADRLIVSGVEPKAKKDGSDPRPVLSGTGSSSRRLARLGADAAEREWGAGLLYRSGPAAKAKRAKARIALPPAGRAGLGACASAEGGAPAAAARAVGDRSRRRCRASAQRGDARGRAARDAHPQPARAAAPRSRKVSAGTLPWRGLNSRRASLTQRSREEIADLVCSILSDPDFASLFGPDSLGEAPLAATLADGRVVAGTVDRLLVEEARSR